MDDSNPHAGFAPLPRSPYGTKLRGRAEIARYHLQDDSLKAQRRVSALMDEVRPENRIPYGIDGDGQPFSYTDWLDDYVRSRARNLPAGPPQTAETELFDTVPLQRAPARVSGGHGALSRKMPGSLK